MKKKNLLKEIIDDREDLCNLYTRSNDAKQEIINIKRTLKLHGEAHMAQDLLPQFRELCKDVAGYSKQISQHILDHKENSREIEIWTLKYHKRVEDLEKRMVQIDIHRDRLADHDECIEALWEKGTENDSGMLSMLKVIPDIEILKTQVAGLEEKPSSKRLMDIETEIKDMREDYHAHFRGLRGDEIKTLIDRTEVLVRDVDALQIRLSRAQDMIAEMQRDSRILKSPGYKKEIAAQKQDAKSKKAK